MKTNKEIMGERVKEVKISEERNLENKSYTRFFKIFFLSIT